MARLTRARYAGALAALCEADSDLAAVVEAFGAPPIWRRPPGFPTLTLLILEQQVSLTSAKATCERLTAAAGGGLAPDSVLALPDEAVRAAGVSRQKTRAVRALAEAVGSGALRLDALGRMDDAAVRAALTAVTGIGAWTAEIYLMMALGRPDVWPVGDLALSVAAERVKRLPARPDAAALDALGEAWRPFRAVAARVLWHYYLNTVRKRGGATAP